MIVWWMEWRSAFARRRLLAWNIGVPSLLLTPVALSPAAAPHRTAVFGVFFVFFAAFGSAIPTVRDSRDGWLDTIFQSRYPRGRWFFETVGAGTVLDFLELLPVTAILVWTSSTPRFGSIAAIGLALLFTLGFANLIGPLIAAAVGSLAEAALASAAVSLLLLHFGGFFRTPTASWSVNVAEWMPTRPLREALAAVQGAPPADLVGWLPAVIAACALAAILLGSVHRWTRRFEWPYGD